ncbi:hypothetical protein JT358_08030 [Micrococcales bacterium 31B]|nr:hypothetical protein [Micrococcales bacterium 31B]
MTIPPMPWFLISLSASGAKLLMALLLLPVVIVAVALYSHYVSRVRLSA